LGSKKQKPQSATDSRAETAEANDGPEPEEFMMVKVTWMQPYVPYMLNKKLSEDVIEERKIIR
jgi:hypothetical protein